MKIVSLSSKVEEIFPPDVGEFVFITDDTYTAKQVKQSVVSSDVISCKVIKLFILVFGTRTFKEISLVYSRTSVSCLYTIVYKSKCDWISWGQLDLLNIEDEFVTRPAV